MRIKPNYYSQTLIHYVMKFKQKMFTKNLWKDKDLFDNSAYPKIFQIL